MAENIQYGPVHFLGGQTCGKYPNCTSIYVEGAGVLIDPATDRELVKEIRDTKGIDQVWFTHWHEDHITHLDLLEDADLWIHEEDAPPVSDLDVFLDRFNMIGPEAETIRAFFGSALRDQFNFKPRTPSRFLQDGEIVDLGSVTVEIIHTPGHTPGHVAFFFREPGVLFMGDYDLTRFGPWYGDLYGSIKETIRSVERLRKVPAKVWVTSHETGPLEEDPGTLWDEYLGVIRRREADLLEFLQEPRTMDDIAGAWIVYRKPREPKEFYLFGERSSMGKHLDDLVAEGRVVLEDERYRLA